MATPVEAAGGAGVGSITWVPALLADEAVSRITHNVLKKFLDEQVDVDCGDRSS